MFSTICDVSESVADFFLKIVNTIGTDAVFFIALAVEALFVIFFLVKSLFSYEASLNRALERINYWLFDQKVVNENNIKDLNMIFKNRAPKRVLYHWQQYILFREGPPSSYLSTENLIEKPLKTSSYNSNIKNLMIFSTIWAFLVAMFLILVYGGYSSSMLTGRIVVITLLVTIFVMLIAIAFVVYLRARKNAILNSLYQNCALFGRFMDNACVDLPTYIDYQILFTPREIEQGQPVLREFLDFKARKEKEEFNKARVEGVNHEVYDFSATGVDGSLVLDRAMKESESFLKKKEKILLKISQLEGELDTRRKNFDGVQKEYQTKIQASKENIERLRQMQEETTNRIESNYYRKQQTTEIGKQEQLEQEFEQQRARYLLEKNEGEEEIAKLNTELEKNRSDVEFAMLSEYQTFFDKFCQSAEKVVAQTFGQKFDALKDENEKDKEYITELEIKLKNKPQEMANGTYDEPDGSYDAEGNYIYSDGTYYDKEGLFHDLKGNIYTQEGKLVFKAEPQEEPQEKQTVNFDDFDDFDFMTDVSQKGDIYGVAQDVIEDIDKNVEVVNNTEKSKFVEEEPKELEEVSLDEMTDEAVAPKTEEQPSKKKGRPKKIVEPAEVNATQKKRGRPRKEKTVEETPRKKAGRPKKIVKSEPKTTGKRGRPRKKQDEIEEINKRLSQEEQRINELRSSINKDLENAMNNINSNDVDDKSARRDELIKEIEGLQTEAQDAMKHEESESKIAEINAKLEKLLEEIKNLNL